VPAPAAPAAAPAGQIPDRILDLLQGIALFGALDRQELRVVLRTASPVQFAPGEVICRQGEPGDCMYVLQAGEVSINVRGAGGKMVPVATLKGGDLLGEMTLVDDAPRSADVVAATEVRAFRIDRDRFDVLREALHPAAFKILRRIALTVCGRLRNVNDAVSRLVGVEGSEKRPDGPGGVKTRQAEDDKQEARSFWSGLLDRVRGG